MVSDISVILSDIQTNNFVKTTINHKSYIIGNDYWVILCKNTLFGFSYVLYVNGVRKELTREEKELLSLELIPL